jgi:hypothetical protein
MPDVPVSYAGDDDPSWRQVIMFDRTPSSASNSSFVPVHGERGILVWQFLEPAGSPENVWSVQTKSPERDIGSYPGAHARDRG